MDFSFSAEQTSLIDTVRKFANTELPDIAKSVETNDTPPSRDIVKKFAELGLLGVNLPEA